MMKVEISDETQSVLDMTIGLTLLVGTLADELCKEGVIDRPRLLGEFARRRAYLDEGEAWPFRTLESALQMPGPRLVWDRDSGGSLSC